MREKFGKTKYHWAHAVSRISMQSKLTNIFNATDVDNITLRKRRRVVRGSLARPGLFLLFILFLSGEDVWQRVAALTTKPQKEDLKCEQGEHGNRARPAVCNEVKAKNFSS
jgi:hypothetical protein